MQTNNKNIVIATVVVLVIAGAGIFYWFLGRSPEASEPITSIPLELHTPTTMAEIATEIPPTTVPIATTESVNTEPTTVPPTAISQPTATVAEVPAIGLYEIMPDQSEVRFKLDEDLRGERIEVVGISSQVAGQIALSLADLSQTQVGTILINARTFATPIQMRNNAIRNFILDTNQYEFITFEPTDIVGLPASAGIGDELTFQIIGNLTIRNITNGVTFNVTATAISDFQLMGSATTTVTREAYNLQIPNVPNVANVEEEVELEIDFVAQISE